MHVFIENLQPCVWINFFSPYLNTSRIWKWLFKRELPHFLFQKPLKLSQISREDWIPDIQGVYMGIRLSIWSICWKVFCTPFPAQWNISTELIQEWQRIMECHVVLDNSNALLFLSHLQSYRKAWFTLDIISNN